MNKELSINEAGKELIKSYEGLRLKAYQDSGGIWTTGYGHTGADVHPGMVISKERAEELFDKDIEKFQLGILHLLTDKENTNPNQFSAMVSLAYNIGLGAFGKSSVLRFHNQGQFQKASSAFGLWNKVNGEILQGLAKRRTAESSLYNKKELDT